jgi:hypothetical protein
MAKLLKNRCRKVDAEIVKGLPGGERLLSLIMVCTVFPTVQGRYLCPKDNLTPNRLQQCLLASKENKTTIKRNDSRRSQTL